MAVFSGGRWIRAQLLAAGSDFWGTDNTLLADVGLSFFHFDGNEDGEDIKASFKSRLWAADSILTLEEREDVTQEAKTIFQLCEALVTELDELFSTPAEVVRDLKAPNLPATALNMASDAAPPVQEAILRNRRLSGHPPTTVTLQPSLWSLHSSLAALVIAVSCASWYAMSRLGVAVQA